MSWCWEQIESDWLGGGRIAVTAAEAVEAFNRAEQTFGADWMTECRGPLGTATGSAPTLEIVTMGQQIATLDGVSGANGLFGRIRRRDASAGAELTAIYLLKRDAPDACVELEPEVSIAGRNRKPDFRIVLHGGDWTYVEVAQPDVSKEYAIADQILKEIGALVRAINGSFALEVCLRRVPTGHEVDDLKRRLPEFCVLGQVARESLGELGFLLLNHEQPGEVTLRHHEGEEKRPSIGIAAAALGADGQHRHIFVRVAFSDERAKQFLESEAKQLPKGEPGLIMVQVSHAPGAFRTWEPILRRRLQPNIHTRVSAVCLFSSGRESTAEGEALVPRAKLISNPNASRPLPDWIGERLSRLAPGW